MRSHAITEWRTLAADRCLQSDGGANSRRQARRLQQRQKADAGSTAPATALAAVRQECAVCLDEPADHLVAPCGHQCGCEPCLTRVKQSGGSCPICRSTISSIVKVYPAGMATADSNAAAPSARMTSMAERPRASMSILEDLDATGTLGYDEWPEEIVDDDANALSARSKISLRIAPVQDVEAPQTPPTPRSADRAIDVIDVEVKITVPETNRKPVDVCVVIDVSGSMGSAATVEADDGTRTDTGLTVLDIVKHSVKTVVKCLDAGDRLSIVAYDSNASTPLELTTMSNAGHGEALAALDGLRPGGSTNMWAVFLT